MIPIFADTFYFIARLSIDDEAHVKAVDFSRLIERLVTTEWIMTELADGVADTLNRHLFSETRAALLADDRTEIVPFDMALHHRAIDLYHSRADKEWSLTDCVSFIVMQDRAMSDALTGDHHFEQAGFRALLD